MMEESKGRMKKIERKARTLTPDLVELEGVAH